MRIDGKRHARIGNQTPAEHLYTLEVRERALCARMHRDRIARNLLQAEITRLRCSLDDRDVEQYRRLVFLKTGEEVW